MTNNEHIFFTYTTSKSVENFASSLGPSLYPGILDFPPAIVVTPTKKFHPPTVKKKQMDEFTLLNYSIPDSPIFLIAKFAVSAI
jgi:hypothetical protein